MPKRKLPRGSSASQVVLEPEIAIATIGIFSALADGESFSQEEGIALDEILSEIDLYEEYSDEDFQELGAAVGRLMREEGAGAAVNLAIAAIAEDEELQEIAYVTALLMIAVDGEVPETEQDYIEDLRQALNVSEERAEEIMDELLADDEEYEEEEYEEEEES